MLTKEGASGVSTDVERINGCPPSTVKSFSGISCPKEEDNVGVVVKRIDGLLPSKCAKGAPSLMGRTDNNSFSPSCVGI